MTDKQIIIYKKECYNEPYCSLNKVLEQLSAKDQECEELKENLPNAITRLMGELDQLKAENEELKDLNTRLDNQRETYWKEYQKLKQALTEIKEIAYIINDRTMVADYICDHLDKILQKCEVLDE